MPLFSLCTAILRRSTRCKNNADNSVALFSGQLRNDVRLWAGRRGRMRLAADLPRSKLSVMLCGEFDSSAIYRSKRSRTRAAIIARTSDYWRAAKKVLRSAPYLILPFPCRSERPELCGESSDWSNAQKEKPSIDDPTFVLIAGRAFVDLTRPRGDFPGRIRSHQCFLAENRWRNGDLSTGIGNTKHYAVKQDLSCQAFIPPAAYRSRSSRIS